MDSSTTQHLQSLLDRLRSGDAAARDELINRACHRLQTLTSKMFRDFPRLRQWEQTEDVSQNSALRLRRALESVAPETVREFFGLAAVQIRRELLDMTRSVYGRKRDAADESGPARVRRPIVSQAPQGADESQSPPYEVDDSTHDPARISAWGDFHEEVGRLPDELREVVDLLFYEELTQHEAAEVLGVHPRTVKRRWRDAKLKLASALEGVLPRFDANS